MVWKLAQSPRKPTLYCAPGNAGIESLATCVPIKADDLAGLKAFVQSEKIDLTVVGPEAPLALGTHANASSAPISSPVAWVSVP